MWKDNQHGATLVEAMVALGFLAAIIGGVIMKFESIQNHARQTERILALDNFEQNLMAFAADRDSIVDSVQRSNNAQLRGCVLSTTGNCQHNREYELPLFLVGQNNPFTGANVFYDHAATVCEGSCEGFRVRTFLVTRCSGAQTCRSPTNMTVRYDIIPTGENQATRRDYVAVRQFQDGKFPGISLSCASPQQIIRGLGINGQAICVDRSQVPLRTESGDRITGTFDVSPRNCAELNENEGDQHFIAGLGANGVIQCGAKFW